MFVVTTGVVVVVLWLSSYFRILSAMEKLIFMGRSQERQGVNLVPPLQFTGAFFSGPVFLSVQDGYIIDINFVVHSQLCL